MRSTLKQLLKEHACTYSEEPFQLKSGRTSHYYVNCRCVLMHPEGGELAARLMRSLIHLHRQPFVGIAGVALGAVPLVDEICTQEYSETSNFWFKAYVRSESKDHGLKSLVEMDYGLSNRLRMAKTFTDYSKPRVALVEDVWTTGGSTMKAKAQLEAAGLDVGAVFVLVDRDEPETERPDYAIYTLEELVDQS